MNRQVVGQLFIAVALGFACMTSCTLHSPTAGVGSGGEARTVVAVAVLPDGAPAADVTVTLLPADHNPARADFRPAGDSARTGLDGSFSLSAHGSASAWTVHGRGGSDSLAFLAVGAELDADTFRLAPEARLIAALPGGVPQSAAYYVPGTRIQASVRGGDSLRIAGLPAGTVSLIPFDLVTDSAAPQAPVFRELAVGSGETLRFGLPLYPRILAARAGDTITLDAGEYHLDGWLTGARFPADNPVIIRAAADGAARIVSGNGLNIHASSGLRFEGLEIAGPRLRGDLVQVHGDSRAIAFFKCRIHHGGMDSHCFHGVNASHITIDSCILHDPGYASTAAGRNGTISFDNVDSSTISRNLLKGTSSRFHVRTTAGSDFVIIEKNIVAEHQGDQGDPAIILGGHSDRSAGRQFEASRIIARNNIVYRSTTGAFLFRGVNDGYVVNNYILDCGGSRGLLRTDAGASAFPGASGVYIFNNLFVNTRGDMPSAVLGRSDSLAGLRHGSNLYHNGGAAIPDGGAFDPASEPGAVFADPKLPVPAGETYESFLESMRPRAEGPWYGAGADFALEQPAPGVIDDIAGRPRRPGEIDIGPFEYAQ